ncbi:hypothetical protein SAMN04487961_1382 [Marinobacter pelagius]|uniref:Uncharacterized protein n=1 Tax=Marinobacter pelagius TaxID=379482 RepID=A0A1I4U0A2_9GAMM|nr:hypothetical protein SAMN04487961_1382 [Marinobacter pelagius]
MIPQGSEERFLLTPCWRRTPELGLKLGSEEGFLQTPVLHQTPAFTLLYDHFFELMDFRTLCRYTTYSTAMPTASAP